MKLIPEKEIAEMCSGKQTNYVFGFFDGVTFAEEKLIPLMEELVEWCFNNVIDHDSKSYYIESSQYNVEFSLEQLLEQFLKTKGL